MSIEQAAERLRRAWATRTPCDPIRSLISEGGIEAAYEVQQRLSDDRIARGGQIVGRKIGLTSRAVQQQLGVDQPDFGSIFADTVHHDGEPIPLGGFLQPKIEAEIAFVLGSCIEQPTPTVADVLRATEFVLPAIEIVDSRVRDWDITILDTIADNASCGAVVLGTVPRRLEGLDLPGLGMSLEHRGQVVSTGSGRACLGSPAIAVTWLARELRRRKTPLCAGEIVLSGALGPMVPVTGPGAYRADFGELGDLTAVFTGGVTE
ncbi:2-keto-4-pentenoate hydratase [Leucobacter triazinivorans]|uniref:2-keto-4-pentenoate hydratase n=1 Tax=Leucobacter triazinivorans TaxID=1784719 RepID=UPI0019806B67|nr:fumarylacetoacetate hydrolase family protein [Leucobacter triazinivorans]